MPTVAEIVERARADLAKAEQREARAREALEAAAAEKQRLTNFLSVLAQYGDSPPAKAGATSSKSRFSKQGTAAVEVITDHMEPLSIDALGDALQQMGVEIGGGAKRNAYLASYLSKDPRLEFIRGKGWWVLELGDISGSAAAHVSEDTEPPDERSSEGSGVVETARNDPADREAGPSLLEPTTYRMGGGGTCN
jgi:hypothetical protein